jgi:hypothetical protein
MMTPRLGKVSPKRARVLAMMGLLADAYEDRRIIPRCVSKG